MDIEKFIEHVKSYPMLYDTKDKNFKNFPRKIEIWEHIGVEMNESSEVLRTKWKGLRDGYTKYKKWTSNKHVSGKSLANWCWGPSLEFLEPHINISKKRNRNSTLGSKDNKSLHLELSPPRSTSQENEQELNSEADLHEEPLIKLEPESAGSGGSSSCAYRSQSRTSMRDPVETTEEEKNTQLLSFMQAKRSKGVDAIDLLFMSYADAFRVFSVRNQAKLKIKMATIFAEAELEEHNLDSSLL